MLLTGADSKYDFYPQPMLGGFGSALCLHPDPARRKAQFASVRFEGKQYMQAPEQCALYKKSKNYPPVRWDLDRTTDIYNLGLLIRHMMIYT